MIMNWKSRLKLLTGLLGVLALVAVLTLTFNQRQTQATSSTAQVKTDAYSIGTDYPGLVVRQFVRVGQDVTKGDRLFTVQSVRLKEDLSNGLLVPSTKTYTVDTSTGTITYRAVISGRVSRIAQLGNSTVSGTPAAILSVSSAPYVVANYTLSPTDYARIIPGAQVAVSLPDNETVAGVVDSVAVATTETGQAQAVVKVAAPALQAVKQANLNQSGTPVVATIDLRDDGPLAGVQDKLDGFLRQIGLP